MTDPNFFGKDNWFYRKYRTPLFCNKDPERDRYNTMKLAINWLIGHNGRTIVETGSQGPGSDWSTGCSTSIFNEIARQFGMRFISIDIEKKNIDFVSGLGPPVEPILSNSVEALGGLNFPVDLLYLDSFDYPYGKILERFGGKEDLNNAIQLAASYSEEAIVEMFSDIITPCQQHTLNEFLAVWDFGHSPVVIVDDAGLPGGGKARLLKKYLLDTSWVVLLEDYQLVMVRCIA